MIDFTMNAKTYEDGTIIVSGFDQQQTGVINVMLKAVRTYPENTYIVASVVMTCARVNHCEMEALPNTYEYDAWKRQHRWNPALAILTALQAVEASIEIEERV